MLNFPVWVLSLSLWSQGFANGVLWPFLYEEHHRYIVTDKLTCELAAHGALNIRSQSGHCYEVSSYDDLNDLCTNPACYLDHPNTFAIGTLGNLLYIPSVKPNKRIIYRDRKN